MERRIVLNILVESELERLEWAQLREVNGPATRVPGALRELLSARSADEVNRAYWKLENHVVVQGQLFQAALYVVPVLIAALVDGERPLCVRIGMTELLFQILNGKPHPDEIARGLGDLTERCRNAALHGLWIFYRELLGENRAGAKEVLELLEGDTSRLTFLEGAIAALANR